MKLSQRETLLSFGAGLISWGIALIIFFPLFWMVLTSFKSEIEAFSPHPSLFFTPIIENYTQINERSDYFMYAWNSVLISGGSTLIAILLAIPAAFSMAFFETKRTSFTLMWIISTKMLPSIGVLVPVYLIYKSLGLLDSLPGLITLYTLINLPIMIWMIYTYFKEIPKDILEAARIDGASYLKEMMYVLLPLCKGGLAATLLLSLILSWNEAFWSLNLTSASSAPLTALVASYSSPEGLFWAKLSAVSTLACAPILLLGWMSQKQLVRGLSFGAVK